MSGTPAAEINVTPAVVRALIADQHPRFAQLPVEFFGEGWDNFTFRLGDSFAVRMPRRAIAVLLIENEQRFLPMLAARLPIPAPSPVAVGVASNAFPWPWSVVPWIEGAPADHAPPDASQGPALAAFLRALHQPADAGAPDNPHRGVPLNHRAERLSACLERVQACSDLAPPKLERAWGDALAAPVSSLRVWLHGDLHAQNVLTYEGAIAGVIDWGDMCAGDPATDLGAIWGLLPDKSARAEAIGAYAPDDALLARARGWAIIFGATLYDAGRVDDPRHMAIGEAILRRLAEDL